MVKYDMLMHYESQRPRNCDCENPLTVKQDDKRRQNWTYYNSAADCSISLKFGTKFDHTTADTLQTFKVQVSKVKVTAWHKTYQQ